MNPEIIIVGAGASGLMAARELAQAGKKVLVLEGRDRIGGRILPVEESVFGYSAQGGAEWVHGNAVLTKALIKEARLTLIPEGGEIWSIRSGVLEEWPSFIIEHDKLKERLAMLTEDIPIEEFLERYFTDESDADFKNSIIKKVEGYDAADPRLISTFMLRDEWLTSRSVIELGADHRIKEGYGPLINFLKEQCEKQGVDIVLNAKVKKIRIDNDEAEVFVGEQIYKCKKCLITVPVRSYKDIDFGPDYNWKHEAASKIGFGYVTKVLIKFTDRWWEHVFPDRDLSNMAFILSNEKFLTWWTQYPEINTVLTGWMAGPTAVTYKNSSEEEIMDEAIHSLSRMFKVDKEDLKMKVLISKVFNWQADPFSQGAYSYMTYTTGDAYEKLAEPIQDTLFFAGEALFSGDITATVESALASGLEVAKKMFELK